MLDLLKLFVHVLVSPFKSQARLEAEIVVLRQQLMVVPAQNSETARKPRDYCAAAIAKVVPVCASSGPLLEAISRHQPVRSARKKAWISAASASGCSSAAKCPPFGITVQRLISV